MSFPKSGNTRDDEQNKFVNDPEGHVAVNTVTSVKGIKDWDSFQVTARNTDGDITQVEYYMGINLVRTIDITYDTDGCLLSYTRTET